jgi:ribonucleoside-diphosphate reductase beta chain
MVAFGPVCSLPEFESWIVTWTFSETIHSRSYTHIIRNVYSNPSKIFDEMMDIGEIVDCASDISMWYDRLINFNNMMAHDPEAYKGNEYEHKKALWLCLMSVNILEGVRFYVSFACSWAFAEVKKMEGNAKIIKFIARDENLHLASTQTLLKILPKDDPDYARIEIECRDEAIKLFDEAVQQEKKWAEYLFKDGSMIGLNYQLLAEYVEFIANKRMQAVGLGQQYPNKTNPLPWTQKWIAGAEVQVAPQEVELSSYVNGGTKQDVDEKSFAGFSL